MSSTPSFITREPPRALAAAVGRPVARSTRRSALPGMMLAATLSSLAAAPAAFAAEQLPAFSAPAITAPDSQRFTLPKRDNPTRDGTRTLGSGNIRAVWFSGLTSRYQFSPFDNPQHPDTLTLSLADHRVMRFTLPADSVFVDRVPRLADIDGDGRDDIVVVRGYLKKGAVLSVLGVRGSAVEVIAETPPSGLPKQWLNPAGIADFDGDGHLDIALVVDPHGVGELQVWTLSGGELTRIADADDVTNHVPGSIHQGLSAVGDFDGDGLPDLAIASQNRYNLRFFSLRGGKLSELGSAPLPAPVAEDFTVVTVAGALAVKVGLAGGKTTTIVPCRAIEDWPAGARCP